MLAKSMDAHETTPFQCPIVVNGIDVLVLVFPTTDRNELPEAIQDVAGSSLDGRAFFIANATSPSALSPRPEPAPSA